MRAQLGYGLLTIGTVAAALGMATLAFGLATGRRALLDIGRRYVAVILVSAIGAFVVMETAMFAHDFSIKYVADNVARATPGLYTFTAVWGALEGSILLWALLLSVYVAVTTWRFRDRSGDPLVAWATLVQYAVLLFFFALMLFSANPFKSQPGAVPFDGRGPNPLLQNHPLVAIHPPFLYTGYVGFAIPFSFALAALITGRFGEGWLAAVRRTTLIAWGFLTVGIVLGAWWSYAVLGWGGFWGWDPVENASLLPWLTATAFIHSVMVQERRGMLRVWNLSLVLATFCLTILGTFLTRSGVINSVHAFSQSSIGPWLLTFLALCAFVSVGLIAWRGDKLRSPGRIDSAVSREAAFLLNNLLFAGFALVVLTGTVFPLLVEALQNKQVTVGEPYFTRLGAPIGIALLFLMAVGPILPWRAASGQVLRDRLLIPAWAGAITLVVTLIAGAHGLANVGAFSLGAFALTSIGRTVVVGIRARKRATSEALPVAAARTVRTNPRLYGGLLVHAGVVVVAIALATTGGYTTKREVQLSPGESARVRGYTITYIGRDVQQTGQKTTIKARVNVSGVGELAPAISTFPNAAEGIGTPSIHSTPWHDVYLTLVSSPTSGRVTIGVQIGTMVMFLWIGGLIMALGCALALVPARKRDVLARSSSDSADDSAADDDSAPAPLAGAQT
ncbi:MAG TPA: heme lyase CcmF/NrfE family subunit [Acidimicrobiia bacterium]|jgi:cytochrome c-type biogenesis protein CcmF|nr:heme lyase CcmF/NrfE family subunit [Acidimicrobiia bacterium]